MAVASLACDIVERSASGHLNAYDILVYAFPFGRFLTVLDLDSPFGLGTFDIL